MVTDRDPLHQLLTAAIPASTENEAVEAFVATQLAIAGEWPSARTSDGISRLRIVQRDPDRVVIAGEIWRIEQTIHAFWLVVTADPDGGAPSWVLHFDVDRARVTESAARGAIEGAGPDELAWRITLSNAPRAGA